MPFQIVHNDITKMNTDAIVNAANSRLYMGGGVCGAIFKAAGPRELQQECEKIGRCNTGEAVITKGYKLQANYIIHAVGPIWRGGNNNEEDLLKSAYINSLNLAKQNGLKSISFPLISSGIYGYPKEEALNVAVSAIKEFLLKDELDIYLVVFDRKAVVLSEDLYKNISHYIDEYYEDLPLINKSRRLNEEIYSYNYIEDFIDVSDSKSHSYKDEELIEHKVVEEEKENIIKENASLDFIINNISESFSAMLLRLIDEKGKTDVEVYKKANIDRKLFSKIRSNNNYIPKKSTVLSLAISLELSLEETKHLLERAGYSLSPSQKFDVIIQYFIQNKEYDIFKINEALFCFEQSLLAM